LIAGVVLRSAVLRGDRNFTSGPDLAWARRDREHGSLPCRRRRRRAGSRRAYPALLFATREPALDPTRSATDLSSFFESGRLASHSTDARPFSFFPICRSMSLRPLVPGGGLRWDSRFPARALYGVLDVKRKILVRTEVIFASASQAAAQHQVSERQGEPFTASMPTLRRGRRGQAPKPEGCAEGAGLEGGAAAQNNRRCRQSRAGAFGRRGAFLAASA
jgi:hypothetical protein